MTNKKPIHLNVLRVLLVTLLIVFVCYTSWVGIVLTLTMMYCNGQYHFKGDKQSLYYAVIVIFTFYFYAWFQLPFFIEDERQRSAIEFVVLMLGMYHISTIIKTLNNPPKKDQK